MRIDLTYDAVTQAEAIMYDRIYSAVALMLRKKLNFGAERIMKCLHGLDDVIGSTMTDEGKGNTGWTELMQELKDETGIVISSGDDGRLFAEISRK